MRRLLGASLISLLFVPIALVLQPREAAACSCLPPPGPVESAQSVDCVFQGKLVSVVDAPKPDKYGLQNKIFTFEVVRTFKGQLDLQVNVTTADNEAACGRNFGVEGTEWLIYARRDELGQLYDNLCSRSRTMQYADADIAELEEHAHELDDEPPKPEQEDPGPGPAEPEPEPEPILPDMASADGHEQPEPTHRPDRCAVTDGAPAGGLAGMLALGLGLGLIRRRR
jgi:MYXO-CTERM domain-containing protein